MGMYLEDHVEVPGSEHVIYVSTVQLPGSDRYETAVFLNSGGATDWDGAYGRQYYTSSDARKGHTEAVWLVHEAVSMLVRNNKTLRGTRALIRLFQQARRHRH